MQVNLALEDDTAADELLDDGALVGAGAAVGEVQAARINSNTMPIPAMRNILDILFSFFLFLFFASCEKSDSCEFQKRAASPLLWPSSPL